MGYYLQAFIVNKNDSPIIIGHYNEAVSVDLGQGLCLVPMTEELFDQINNFNESPCISDFQYLTENVEKTVLELFKGKRFAYIEAEYHGGQGGQIGVIWSDSKIEQIFSFGQNKINEVLRQFGAQANKGEDEFLTMGFGLRRHTRDWIDNNE